MARQSRRKYLAALGTGEYKIGGARGAGGKVSLTTPKVQLYCKVGLWPGYEYSDIYIVLQSSKYSLKQALTDFCSCNHCGAIHPQVYKKEAKLFKLGLCSFCSLFFLCSYSVFILQIRRLKSCHSTTGKGGAE